MANRLYETRVLQRISQYVLALKTGIPQPRISIIQNSLVTPREDEKNKIAKALGVKAEDIFPQEVSNDQ
jgi:transcriptional regulator with XRE-family HTH domain